MNSRFKYLSIGLWLLTFLITGCPPSQSGTRGSLDGSAANLTDTSTTTTTSTTTDALACTAVPRQTNYNFNSSTGYSDLVTVDVNISGAQGPVTVEGYSGGSATSTLETIAGYFNSSGLVSRTVQITDTVTTATCNFSVNIGLMPFSCTIAPVDPITHVAISPFTPSINQPVAFQVTVNGAANPQFQPFYPDSGAAPIGVSPSGNIAYVTTSYATTGTKNASEIVTSNGTQITCQTSFQVLNPRVGLTADATQVVSPNVATLTATALDIPSATFAFSNLSQTPGCRVLPANPNAAASTSATATVQCDSNYEAITVGVTATASSGIAYNSSLALVFNPANSLTCQVVPRPGTYFVGDEVIFDATASTGEPLTISKVVLSPNDGGVMAFTNASSFGVAYFQSGPKFLQVFASHGNHVCNGNLGVVAAIPQIYNFIACRAIGPAYLRTGIAAQFTAQIIPGTGIGPFEIVNTYTVPAYNIQVVPVGPVSETVALIDNFIGYRNAALKIVVEDLGDPLLRTSVCQ